MTSDGRRGSVKPERVGPDGKPAPGTRWYFVADTSLPGEARKQAKRRGFPTKKAAQAGLTELLSEVRDRTFVAPDKLTLREFVEQRWLPVEAGQLRPSTLHSYTRNMKHHVLPTLGAITLQSLDAGRIQALYAKLLREGRADYKEGTALSPRTVRYIHTILRAALAQAVDWDLLMRNPADRVKPPKLDAAGNSHETIHTWNREQLSLFLAKTRDDRLHSLWLLLATTGMRRGEALGLSWAALDLDNARLSVRRSLVDVTTEATGAKPIYSDPKTARGRRTIMLDAGTVAVLRKRKAEQAQERLLLGAGWPDHDLVFTHADGRPLHPERLTRTFTAMPKGFGLPAIRLHGLRHTWATLALEAGIHPKVVSERLGHSSISITLDTYSHVAPAMQTDAAERVAALISG